ncbi:MAG: hypothetical protein KDA41_13475 [Planctomycetales bacterium]|nr:hypothetical protein [Planctomycetales bacterium]
MAEAPHQWVQISFDCLPLRSVGRLDVPIDASPKYRRRCEKVKACLDKHGSLNTYFLYNARCIFHVTNDVERGMLEFRFEGTLLTDEGDLSSKSCDLDVELLRETCDWLTEPIVQWFTQTVTQAVLVEFDRYIAAGDLAQTKQRLDQIQSESDDAGGYLGMYL